MKPMAEIHQFNHHAMATYFQVRIANQDKTYAAQAAQAALDLLDGTGRSVEPFSREQRHRADRSSCVRREDAFERARLCLPANREADGRGYTQCVLPNASRIEDSAIISTVGATARRASQFSA